MFNFSRNRTYNKKKILVMSILFLAILIFLIGRVVYLIFYRGEELSEKAKSLQERERTLVAQRERYWTEMELSWQKTKRYITYRLCTIKSRMKKQS